MRSKQLSFHGSGFKKPADWFGGGKLKSHPKTRRPLHSKLPIHLVLRARKSVLRLPKNQSVVEKTIRQTARKYGIRIFEYANVGNHLHLLIRVSNVALWRRFIREISGRIAQLARPADCDSAGGFWLNRPFTRIVRGWRRAYRVVRDYIVLNQLEAECFIDLAVMRSVRDLRRFIASTA